MTTLIASPAALAARIRTCPVARHRRLIALAGAPGSGKSTLAETLAQDLVQSGTACAVVPMDGFHLDNRLLDERGLRARKGAPQTFDAAGFLRLVDALHAGGEVIFPLFDRARDIAIAGAGAVPPGCDTVLLEGNYLLYDAPVWRELSGRWDLSVFIDTPADTLRERLTRRWLDHGLPPDAARDRAEGNDMVNVRAVLDNRLRPDILYRPDTMEAQA